MRPLVHSSTITVRLPREARALVEDAARREGASTSDLIRRALATVVQAPASSNASTASGSCR